MTFIKTRAFQEPTLRDIALEALILFENGEDNFYDTAVKVNAAYQDDKRVNGDLDIRLIKKARENAFQDLLTTSHNTPAQLEMLQEFKDVIDKIIVTNQRNRTPLPLVVAPRVSETVHTMESTEYVGYSIRIEFPDPELEAGELTKKIKQTMQLSDTRSNLEARHLGLTFSQYIDKFEMKEGINVATDRPETAFVANYRTPDEAGEDIVADFRKALEKVEDAVKTINNTGLGLN